MSSPLTRIHCYMVLSQVAGVCKHRMGGWWKGRKVSCVQMQCRVKGISFALLVKPRKLIDCRWSFTGDDGMEGMGMVDWCDRLDVWLWW